MTVTYIGMRLENLKRLEKEKAEVPRSESLTLRITYSQLYLPCGRLLQETLGHSLYEHILFL